MPLIIKGGAFWVKKLIWETLGYILVHFFNRLIGCFCLTVSYFLCTYTYLTSLLFLKVVIHAFVILQSFVTASCYQETVIL